MIVHGVGIHRQQAFAQEGPVWLGHLDALQLLLHIGLERSLFGGRIAIGKARRFSLCLRFRFFFFFE